MDGIDRVWVAKKVERSRKRQSELIAVHVPGNKIRRCSNCDRSEECSNRSSKVDLVPPLNNYG